MWGGRRPVHRQIEHHPGSACSRTVTRASVRRSLALPQCGSEAVVGTTGSVKRLGAGRSAGRSLAAHAPWVAGGAGTRRDRRRDRPPRARLARCCSATISACNERLAPSPRCSPPRARCRSPSWPSRMPSRVSSSSRFTLVTSGSRCRAYLGWCHVTRGMREPPGALVAPPGGVVGATRTSRGRRRCPQQSTARAPPAQCPPGAVPAPPMSSPCTGRGVPAIVKTD